MRCLSRFRLMGSNSNQIQKTTVISVVNKIVAFAVQAVMIHSGEQLNVFKHHFVHNLKGSSMIPFISDFTH